MDDAPPGAQRTLVEGRSLSTFPELGLAPLAKLLDVIFPTTCSSTAGASPPKQMVELPPGAQRILVVDRSVMQFPAFWLEPLAKLLELPDIAR